MRFSIDYTIDVGDATLSSSEIIAEIDKHRDELNALGDVGGITGELVLKFGERAAAGEYNDPILRLVSKWLGKVTWVIAADTETVALRNSEHCYAFVPTGDGVEISFFEGDEAEIEEYVIEPTNVRLEEFVAESIKVGERLTDLVAALDESQLTSSEDCKDLVSALSEAREAWRKHERKRR